MIRVMEHPRSHVVRIGFVAGVCCLAAIFASPSVLAMPTKDQLAKAEKLVAEIMQSEVGIRPLVGRCHWANMYRASHIFFPSASASAPIL